MPTAIWRMLLRSGRRGEGEESSFEIYCKKHSDLTGWEQRVFTVLVVNTSNDDSAASETHKP